MGMLLFPEMMDMEQAEEALSLIHISEWAWV